MGDLTPTPRTYPAGATSWIEGGQADVAAALDFYGGLVDQGWATAVQLPGYGDHLAATSDPGIRERQAHLPEGFGDVIGSIGPVAEGETPHWHVTFTVADREASVQRVRDLGGVVESATEDSWTRKAVVRDPQGARFTLSQFTPPDR